MTCMAGKLLWVQNFTKMLYLQFSIFTLAWTQQLTTPLRVTPLHVMPHRSSHVKKCEERWPSCHLPSDMVFLTENNGPVILVGSVAFFTIASTENEANFFCLLFVLTGGEFLGCPLCSRASRRWERSTWGGLEKWQTAIFNHSFNFLEFLFCIKQHACAKHKKNCTLQIFPTIR